MHADGWRAEKENGEIALAFRVGSPFCQPSLYLSLPLLLLQLPKSSCAMPYLIQVHNVI